LREEERYIERGLVRGGKNQGRALAHLHWGVGAAAGGFCLAIFFFGSASAEPPGFPDGRGGVSQFQPPVTKSGAAPGFMVAFDTRPEAKALCDRAGVLFKHGTSAGDNQALTGAIDSYRRSLALMPRSESCRSFLRE